MNEKLLSNFSEEIHSYFELPYSAEERKKLVGKKLIEIRKAIRLTQKEVCAIIGITPQTYSGYEKGKYEPNMETIVRLSFLYNTSIDFLLCRNKNRVEKDSEIEDYAEYMTENIKDTQKSIAFLRHEVEELKERINQYQNKTDTPGT